MQNIHGIQVLEEALGAPPLRSVNISTIGLVGTAPNVVTTGKFAENGVVQYNKPYLITRRSQAPDADLGAGDSSTLKEALDLIYAQGNPRVVFSIIEAQKGGTALTVADLTQFVYDQEDNNTVGQRFTFEGTLVAAVASNTATYLKVKGLIEGIETRLDAITLADNDFILIKEGDTVKARVQVSGDYDTTNDRYPIKAIVAGTDTTAAGTAVSQSLPQVEAEALLSDDAEYMLSIDRATAGVVPADDNAVIRGRAIGNEAAKTGVYSLLNAKAETGVKPSIILAPNLNTQERPGNSKNPLAAALEAVAKRLKAIAIVDADGSSVADATTYAGDFDSDRVYMVAPKVKVGSPIQVRDASPAFAGLTAVNDATRGWWTPISNRPLLTVLGTVPTIDFEMGDANSTAQLFNDAGLATIINEGGYRSWGNETHTPGNPHTKFLNVRRTMDVISQTMQLQHLWAVDRLITVDYLRAVSEGVNAYLRELESLGAIAGGLCYPDADLNTAEAFADGKAFFNVKFTPYYPAQTITIKVTLTQEYAQTAVV